MKYMKISSLRQYRLCANAAYPHHIKQRNNCSRWMKTGVIQRHTQHHITLRRHFHFTSFHKQSGYDKASTSMAEQTQYDTRDIFHFAKQVCVRREHTAWQTMLLLVTVHWCTSQSYSCVSFERLQHGTRQSLSQSKTIMKCFRSAQICMEYHTNMKRTNMKWHAYKTFWTPSSSVRT